MVATVGSISIDLSTNAAKFASGFKSSANTVDQQSARMAKSIAKVEKGFLLAGGSLKTFVGGLAAGAGLAAIASLGGAFEKLKQTISEYDDIATNAKTTGLSTDTYQALAFAAQKANISQESYNSALNIFAKNAGLAAIGQGALFSGLKKLNPQLLQNILNTKDQEERLKLVADAMARTSDATKKAALSAAIFGKGGVEIARILEDGRRSIDDFKESARKLGIIIPADLLERGKELDDILDDLSKVIHVQLGEALVNAAPLLVSFTTGLANLTKEVNGISKAITDFVNNPSVVKLRELIFRLTGNTIIPGSLADAVINGLKFSEKDVAELTSGIDFLEQKLAELKIQAEQGANVKLEIEEATQSLDELKSKLQQIQGVGEGAAKAISASFAQAFREAENASMTALASMRGGSGLPNVTRFGGDPNKIELPNNRFNYQENANGSGVNRTSFGGSNPDTRETADNTEDTADNVSSLDRNTKTYIQSLSDDMGQYSAQQIQAENVVINRLSDTTAQQFGMLSSAILSMLVHNNDSGATGTGDTMFGDAFDSQYGSYISSWGVGKVKRGSYDLASTSDDGTSDTSVNVQQPGTNITLNYTAAKGEGEGTARQNARAMFDELLLQASRA